jgi:hypothetical protein
VELGSHAVAAVTRNEFTLISECKQGIRARINTENYISAVSAVSTRGAACRNVFLSVKGYSAVSAVTCLNIDFYLVYKHIVTSFRE